MEKFDLALKEKAEKDLKGMLDSARLPVRPSYSPGEVRIILGISEREFHHLVNSYEVNPQNGLPRHPCSLDSFRLRNHRRVRYGELVDFLRRNNTLERNCV